MNDNILRTGQSCVPAIRFHKKVSDSMQSPGTNHFGGSGLCRADDVQVDFHIDSGPTAFQPRDAYSARKRAKFDFMSGCALSVRPSEKFICA